MRIVTLLLCVLIAAPYVLANGWTFGSNSTDRIVHAGANLTSVVPFTVLTWVRTTTLTAGRRFWCKANGTGCQKNIWVAGGSGTELRAEVARATTWADSLSTGAGLSANTWYCVMYTYNETDGVKIYVGTETTGLTELSYSTQVVGSGATQSDSGGDLYIGNTQAANSPYLGTVFSAAYFDVNLTTTQGNIYKEYFHPYAVESLRANIRHITIYGHPGGNALDWSGNGYNGTITGGVLGAGAPAGVEYYTPGTLSIARALRGLWQTFFFSHLPAEV